MANQTAELGDTVKVHYVGKLSDGEVFDQSKQEEPISFEIGKGQLIQGFEQAVVGMAAGDTKTEQVPYDFAYGERRDDLVLELDKDKIPEHKLESHARSCLNWTEAFGDVEEMYS